MQNHKDIAVIAGLIIGGFIFLSGAANYGYAGEKGDFLASLVKFAQAVDETISPVITPTVPEINPSTPRTEVPQDTTIVPVPINNFSQPGASLDNGSNFSAGTGTSQNFSGVNENKMRENTNGNFGGGDINRNMNRGAGNNFSGKDNQGEGNEDEFIDPREIKNALKEMKDMKREVKRFQLSAKRLQNADAMVSEVNSLSSKIASFEDAIKNTESSGTGVRDAIQEYRDAELWNEINTLRSKIELPKELKNSDKELKKLKKMAAQKTYQVFGLDFSGLQSWISEAESVSSKLNSLYSAGNWEDLNSEMEDYHERPNPGEITSTLYRLSDLSRRARIVRDSEVKQSINDSLSDVRDSFNKGDYRAAREALDEYYDDLQRLINSASKIGAKGGMSEDDFNDRLGNLKGLIEQKMGQKLNKNKTEENLEPPFNEPQNNQKENNKENRAGNSFNSAPINTPPR